MRDANETKDHVDGEMKVDMELFVHSFKTNRGWNNEKGLSLWEELKADPDIGRDEGGPKWRRLRLFVPSNMMGGVDRIESRKGKAEEKILSRQSKAAALNKDEVDTLRTEMAKGFKRPFSCEAEMDTMHSAMPAGSTSAAGGESEKMKTSSSSLMMSTLADANLGAQQQGSQPAAQPAAKVEGGDDGNFPKGKCKGTKAIAGSPADIRIDRETAWRSKSEMLKTLFVRYIDASGCTVKEPFMQNN